MLSSIIIMAIMTLTICQQQNQKVFLNIISTQDPVYRKKLPITLDLEVSSFSSPIDNLNSHQKFILIMSEPVDVCTNLKMIHNQTRYQQRQQYMLVANGDEGFCGLKRKISKAKQAGARGLIITHQKSEHPVNINRQLSSTPFFVFVAKDYLTIDFLLNNQEMLVSLSQDIPYADKKHTVELWISSTDSASYQMLEYWQQTIAEISILNQIISWKPRYVIEHCQNCKSNIDHCICNVQFCSPFVSSDSPNTNQSVIEDVRQKIIHMDYRDRYLIYMRKFWQQCYNSFMNGQLSDNCISQIEQDLGIDSFKVQTLKANFVYDCEGLLLHQMRSDRNKHQSTYTSYPSLILDGEPIQFTYKNQLKGKLCLKLNLQNQSECQLILNEYKPYKSHLWFYLGIILFLFTTVFVAAICYRKRLRKDLHKELKMQVSTSVSNYFQLG